MHSAMGDGTVKKGVRLPLWGRVALAAMRSRRRKTGFWGRPWIGLAVFLCASFAMMLADLPGCRRTHCRAALPADAEADEVQGDSQELLVTGYCNCGKCCGWRKKWFLFGEPVYNYGTMKGSPKKVGVTASGKIAAKGTIAADLSVYPFGTKMEIPGYGAGVVQDIGGSIKGAHIDLWFPTHADAIAWGAQKLKVKIEKAKAEKPKPQDEKPKIQAEKPKTQADKAKK